MFIDRCRGLRSVLLPVALVSGVVVVATAAILAAGQRYVERMADTQRTSANLAK